MTKTRQEISSDNKWNISSIYPSLQEWRSDFETAAAIKEVRWPELSFFKDKLHLGPEHVKNYLDLFFEIDRKISKLYTYAHLKHDEETTDEQSKAAFNEAQAAFHIFQEEAAWFEPELLSLPQATISSYLNDKILEPYRFYLEKIFRLKPHTLSKEQELIMAMAGKPLSGTYKAFRALSDADLPFPVVVDGDGQPHELSHSKYGLLIRSHDRTLRKNAFTTYHGAFKQFQNTLCELLSGQIDAHVFSAKTRGFKTALDAFLFPKNIDSSVYHSLIQAVHEEIDALHRYFEIRSRVLKLKPLHMYDIQVPLTPNFDMQIPYEEAEDLVIESVAPLGEEYQNILRQGLKTDRWVDRYENLNKRSGAYSSGCYDSMPFILMNYKNIARDVFTLAHEIGHSMHSYLSHKQQPYVYSHYPIFLAEVASTFNEELLLQTLLKRARSPEEKIFLLTQKIEDIRATLFRQTQFAEFELLLHTWSETSQSITPGQLCTEYEKLNSFYYGPNVISDPEIGSEWSRIPHFYFNYYVYQYATGISAAQALSSRVLGGGKEEREDYLSFLKSGDSLYPIEALLRAGVDMRTNAPVKLAIKRFRALLDELERELAHLPK